MYDLIILGSGPAGLSAAVYASRAGMRFAVVEKEFMGTGQIAYTERVDNFLGYYGTHRKAFHHAGYLYHGVAPGKDL